jgi:hypothetical protein
LVGCKWAFFAMFVSIDEPSFHFYLCKLLVFEQICETKQVWDKVATTIPV